LRKAAGGNGESPFDRLRTGSDLAGRAQKSSDDAVGCLAVTVAPPRSVVATVIIGRGKGR